MARKSKPITVDGKRYVSEKHHIEETTELIHDRDGWKEQARVSDLRNTTIAFQNRQLRAALSDVLGVMKGTIDARAGIIQQGDDALALDLTQAEKVVQAMDNLCATATLMVSCWRSGADGNNEGLVEDVDALKSVKKYGFMVGDRVVMKDGKKGRLCNPRGCFCGPKGEACWDIQLDEGTGIQAHGGTFRLGS